MYSKRHSDFSVVFLTTWLSVKCNRKLCGIFVLRSGTSIINLLLTPFLSTEEDALASPLSLVRLCFTRLCARRKCCDGLAKRKNELLVQQAIRLWLMCFKGFEPVWVMGTGSFKPLQNLRKWSYLQSWSLETQPIYGVSPVRPILDIFYW